MTYSTNINHKLILYVPLYNVKFSIYQLNIIFQCASRGFIQYKQLFLSYYFMNWSTVLFAQLNNSEKQSSYYDTTSFIILMKALIFTSIYILTFLRKKWKYIPLFYFNVVQIQAYQVSILCIYKWILILIKIPKHCILLV